MELFQNELNHIKNINKGGKNIMFDFKNLIMESSPQNIDQFNEKAQELLNGAAAWIFSILAMCFVMWGIYIGIKWMTAKKAEQYQEAKELLKRFFVGLILIFVIAAVAGIVLATMKKKFGIE